MQNQPNTPEKEQSVHAQKIFHSDISPYFTSIYGERWVLLHRNESYTRDWIIHLLGLDIDQISQGIELMCLDGRVNFIPSPLEFRSLCIKGAKEQKKQNTLKVL